MRRLLAQRIGRESTSRPRWSEICEDPGLAVLLEGVSGHPTATPLQERLLREGHFDRWENLVIRAATNSGKSTVATALMAAAVRDGGTAVLLEPLREIARERFEEMDGCRPVVSKYLGRKAVLRLWTGDTSHNGDTLHDPLTGSSCLAIATPERLESVWRRSESLEWINGVRCLVVDEYHLLADPRRGPTLDLVLSSFACLTNPPRLILMSATPFRTNRVSDVLSPCTVLEVGERTPPLEIEVWDLEDEARNEAVRQVFSDPGARGPYLVFVSTVAGADSLARELQAKDGLAAASFHAKLSSEERGERRAAFLGGRINVLVATTALAMGVNLPAQTVVVRDVEIHGRGRLSCLELLQMVGRAGRGELPGKGIILLRSGDPWDPGELVQGLEAGSDEERTGPEVRSAVSFVVGVLSRHGKEGVSFERLFEHGRRSLLADLADEDLEEAVEWLSSDTNRLVGEEGGKYHLTRLGEFGAKSMLPLELVAGMGRLWRDLIDSEVVKGASNGVLAGLTPLDMLGVAAMVCRPRWLLRWRKGLDATTEMFYEGNPQSRLYSRYVYGSAGRKKARELVCSVTGNVGIGEADAYRLAVRAFASIGCLWSLAQGKPIRDVEKGWSARDLDGILEQMRDDSVFYLTGIAQLLDLRSIYRHLKNRGVDGDRIRQYEQSLGGLRSACLEAVGLIAYCSPLGPLVLRLRGRKSKSVVSRAGLATIRRLERLCGSDLDRLRGLSRDQLVQGGIRGPVADRLLRVLHGAG